MHNTCGFPSIMSSLNSTSPPAVPKSAFSSRYLRPTPTDVYKEKCTQGKRRRIFGQSWGGGRGGWSSSTTTSKCRHIYRIVLLLEIWCWCMKAENTASSYEPSSSISEQSLGIRGTNRAQKPSFLERVACMSGAKSTHP
jgi:hypothetical protein